MDEKPDGTEDMNIPAVPSGGPDPIDRAPGPSAKSHGGPEDLSATVQELAEDMLGLYKKVTALEAKADHLVSALGQIQQAVEGTGRSLGMELDRLKQSLVSDRKELIGRSTFNALLPAVESLQAMKRRLQARKGEEKLLRNTQTLLDLLTGIFQALRYAPFDVPPGTDFDPYTMECLGYASGDPGKVVRVEHSGYRAGSVLVRPCGVILGAEAGQASPGRAEI